MGTDFAVFIWTQKVAGLLSRHPQVRKTFPLKSILIASCLTFGTPAFSSDEVTKGGAVLTLNIPPISSAVDRTRLWQAILKTAQMTIITVKPSETPETAIRARCGSAPSDLIQFLYDLNPEMIRSATTEERTLKFIPCPYWYFGKDGAGPKVPVKTGEKLENLLPALMGTISSTAASAVADKNPTLVNAKGEIVREGQLALPYVTRRLNVPVTQAGGGSNALSLAQPILGALPANAKKVVKSSGINISPNEYHLVGTDEPVTDDPIKECGGPQATNDWPSNVEAIGGAYESARNELITWVPPGVIVVADTGIDPVDPVIQSGLWTNSSVLNGLPSATNFRKDLHGASMVTRSGDDIASNPGYQYNTHGTDVVRVIMEPAVRSSKLAGGTLVAIAKLNDETYPFTIELNSIPSAFGYARAISADALSLSVVIGAPVDALLQGLQAANFLVVAAAGNNGMVLEQQSIFPPAMNQLRDHLLVVGAHDWRGNVAWFSNKGPLVDILAPGCAIPQVLTKGEAVKLLSGTSFAAPFVSLTVGLLRSIGMPSSPLLLKTRILASGDFDPNLIGWTRYGVRLNMERALRIRQDSITRKVGSVLEVLYGDIESPQTWSCDVRGDSRAFNTAQVFKVLPNFPAENGSAVRVWARPSLGELVEVQCDGPFDQAMLRFKPEGSSVTNDYPWSEINDVVPRVSPD